VFRTLDQRAGGQELPRYSPREPVQVKVLTASRMTAQRARGSAGQGVLDAAGSKCQGAVVPAGFVLDDRSLMAGRKRTASAWRRLSRKSSNENVMSVYRVTEVIGTSGTSWEDAAAEAIRTAAATIRDLRVASSGSSTRTSTDPAPGSQRTRRLQSRAISGSRGTQRQRRRLPRRSEPWPAGRCARALS
jgi:flavin-binding protein dodecin